MRRGPLSWAPRPRAQEPEALAEPSSHCPGPSHRGECPQAPSRASWPHAHSSLHIRTCSQHWPSCLWGVATTLVLKGCGSPEQGPKRQERLPYQGPSELDLDGCTGVCSWRHRGKAFPVEHPSSPHPLSSGARVGTSLGPSHLPFLTLWSVAVCPLLSPVHFIPFPLSIPAPTTRPQGLSE